MQTTPTTMDVEGGEHQPSHGQPAQQTTPRSAGHYKLHWILASVVVIGLALSMGYGLGGFSNNSERTSKSLDGAKPSADTADFMNQSNDVTESGQSPVAATASSPTPSPTYDRTTAYTPSPTMSYTPNPTILYTPYPTIRYTRYPTPSPSSEAPTKQPTPTTSPTPYPTFEFDLNATLDLTSTTARAYGLSAISRQSITETYSDCEDLYMDLRAAVRMMGVEYIETFASSTSYFPESNQDDYYAPDDDGILSTDRSTTVGTDDEGTTKLSDSTDSSDDAKATQPNSWGTNNQHAGVEEVDLVQSNGVQIFTIYGEEIVVMDAATMSILNRTTVSFAEAEDNCYLNSDTPGMLLVNESLVVFVSGYCYVYDDSANIVTSSYSETYYRTKVVILDSSTLTIQSNETLPGSYISARAVGSNVYTVTSSALPTGRLTRYLDINYVQNLDAAVVGDFNETTYRKLAREQLELNLDSVVRHMLEYLDCESLQKLALMQNVNDTVSSTGYDVYGGALNQLVSISSFAVGSTLSAANSTSALTSMIIPGGDWQVYASEEYLIVATEGSYFNSSASSYYTQPQTFMIGYKLSGPSATAMILGSVPGTLLDQYSLDHVKQDGLDYLRVATTDSSESTSMVTVLQLAEDDDGMMPIVGQLTGLGKIGERIFGVRFQGDRAFVVTFLVTDPFYTIDLSDPTNPQSVGELEVPGWSTYLHPVGEDLILGVGETLNNVSNAVSFQLSLFDVSNFSQPRLVQQWETGTNNQTVTATSVSQVEYSTKAFRFLDDSNILIIPMTVEVFQKLPCTSSYGTPTTTTTRMMTK